MKKLFTFFIIVTSVSSCYYDNFDENSPAAKLNTSCDTLSPVSYSNMIKPIIDNYCIFCHSTAVANGGVILDNYSGILNVANAGKLEGSLSQQNGSIPMPPNSKLNSCNIRQIQLWIKAGAPNN